MKKLLKPFDYIFVLMPVQFFAVWAVFLAGFFVQSEFGVAATESVMGNHAAVDGSRTFLWIGAALTLLMGAIFIVHQVMDRGSEEKKKEFFLITKGQISPKAALIESAIFLLLALIAGFLFSVEVGIVFLVLLLLAGFFYNFPPFSWKDKAALSLVTNLIAAFLIFSAGWVVRGHVTTGLLLHALPYLAMMTAINLYSTVKESAVSESQSTLYIGLALQIVAGGLAYTLKDEVIFYPALFALPFYIWAAAYPAFSEVRRAIKYSILILTLAVCVKWSVVYSDFMFFFIVAGVYFGSKIYYRLRMGINYPTLSV